FSPKDICARIFGCPSQQMKLISRGQPVITRAPKRASPLETCAETIIGEPGGWLGIGAVDTLLPTGSLVLMPSGWVVSAVPLSLTKSRYVSKEKLMAFGVASTVAVIGPGCARNSIGASHDDVQKPHDGGFGLAVVPALEGFPGGGAVAALPALEGV